MPSKSHHFLPQVIQKQFSEDGKFIFRYDKQLRSWKQLPTKGNATITNANTFFRESGERDTTLENEYFTKQIDNHFLDLLEHIKLRGSLGEKNGYIAELFAAMYGRVPKQRSNMRRIVDDLNQQLNALGAEERYKARELHNKSLLASLVETVVYYSQISSYYWVAIAPRKINFLTSDNPCGNAFIPISPEYLIASSSKRKDPKYAETPEQIMRMFNQLIFDRAEKYVYSSHQLDMSFYETGRGRMPNREGLKPF